MQPLQAILFDLGDTLVDLGEGRGDYEERVIARAGRAWDRLAAAGMAPPSREAFALALAHESEALYHAALAEQRGIDIFDVLHMFLPRWGIPNDDGTAAMVADAFYEGTESGAGLRRGASETLAALRVAGFRLGVISNTLMPRRYMDAALVRRGIAHFFEVTVYSSEERVAKPHPRIFQAALNALRLPAERVLYVGDRPETDVLGAQAVGMKTVLIAVPHRRPGRTDIVPDAHIAELNELPAILAAFPSQPTTQPTN